MNNNDRSDLKKRAEIHLQRMSEAVNLHYAPHPARRYSRKEIAQAMRISANDVGKLLREAERHKIIEIKINPRFVPKIREELRAAYRLRDVIISPVFPEEDRTTEALAREAARFFDSVVSQDHTSSTTVGISGGRTIHKMVEMIDAKSRQINIYPLTGIWRDLQINYVDSGVLVHSLWLKCNDAAKAYWFPIEPLVTERMTKESVIQQRKAYLRNKQIRMVFEAATSVDIAFIGVGPVREKSATIAQLSGIGITYDRLKRQGAVGIAAGVWYNKNAEPVIDDYFLSVPLDTFKKLARRKTKRVVVVAAGDDKVEPIDVLLKHHICNVLITDTRTASLLSMRHRKTPTNGK